MARNGNRKEKDIRTINLGKPGEPARELIEIYERQFGKNKISKLIRELIVCHLSPKKEFDGYKIKQLQEERKILMDQLKEQSEMIQQNAAKLLRLGVDIE